MSGAAPTLSLGVDPSVLKSLGDVERMEKAALAGIREIERQALALEKKGQTLTDQQKARLRQFEKLQTEARDARSAHDDAVDAAERTSSSNKQAMRDLKILRSLDRLRIVQNLSEGNWSFFDLAASLRDKHLQKASDLFTRRLGLKQDLLQSALGGAHNLLPAVMLAKTSYDAWAKITKMTSKGAGFLGSSISFEKQFLDSASALQSNVNSGETSYAAQRLALQNYQNTTFTFGSDLDQQAKTHDAASRAFADRLAGTSINAFGGTKAERIASLQKIIKRQETANNAVVRAFEKTQFADVDPSERAQLSGPRLKKVSQYLADIFTRNVNYRFMKAIAAEMNRTGKPVDDKFREQASRDAYSNVMEMFVNRHKFSSEKARELSENINKELSQVHWQNADPLTPDRHTEELKRYESHLETVREALDEQSALARFNRYRVPARFNQ